ncbi:MAG: hypothetical protein Q9220_005659 [cf. Caloplaca sp. 1 TL-2023]
MQQDEGEPLKETKISSKRTKPPWLTSPKLIKRLFDTFPLITYPENDLPKRCHIERQSHRLHIFRRTEDASNAPSFNPTCLKWQTYLKFKGVSFTTVQSCNHASPTGALPFLLPASGTADSAMESLPPIASTKLQNWAEKHGRNIRTESENIRYEAYMSLVDHRIRNAWLHTLYLTPANFDASAHTLYIQPVTSTSAVRFALARILQAAALGEIVKASVSPVVDLDALYRESDNAFSALSDLLGNNDWFFGEETPGLLDAAVFGYTYLLCDSAMGWQESEERQGQGLRKGRWKNLFDHKERIYKEWYQ